MIDQLSSRMIGVIAIYSPLEDNTDIPIDDQLSLAIYQL